MPFLRVKTKNFSVRDGIQKPKKRISDFSNSVSSVAVKSVAFVHEELKTPPQSELPIPVQQEVVAQTEPIQTSNSIHKKKRKKQFQPEQIFEKEPQT